MQSYKSFDTSAELLLQRMKKTGSWKLKERLPMETGYKIVEHEVQRNLIEGTKVLILNASQGPKCSLSQNKTMLDQCWTIPGFKYSFDQINICSSKLMKNINILF